MSAPFNFRSLAGVLALARTAALLGILVSCTSATRLVLNGDERERQPVRAPRGPPYVLIFALDGVNHDQMMEALRSGKMPKVSALLGAPRENGIYEHGDAVPNAVSILPSTTVAAWSSIFTGVGPALDGVPGNEWFVREHMQFLAPAPISVKETDDTRRAIAEDLVGKALQVPTLFQMVSGPAYVSLNDVHYGADFFTTVTSEAFATLMGEFVAAKLEGPSVQQNTYAQLDQDSVPKVIDILRRQGIPTVQVVYFPGIDLYTHLADDPLHAQVDYLSHVTDPAIGKVLAEYRREGVLDDTYIIFISDHGHTPVLKDERHALGAHPELTAPGLLRSLGFRVRPDQLTLSEAQSDYQAVLAYQGAMAYVYLADRSSCMPPNQTCNWGNPPRFEQDVMPVVRAFYNENREGRAFPALKGTLDLVFARKPVPLTQEASEYQIYDGAKLISIADYLRHHPRPDLIQLERRMRWLSAGPYGHRAGDVLLLAKSGLGRPINDRYYFSAPYNSWHGSPSEQDSHIVLIVARANLDGQQLRQKIAHTLGKEPSQIDVVPLIRALLAKP